MIFEELERDLEKKRLTREAYKLCAERLRSLLRFQKKVQTLGSLAEKLMF
jgi:hypothetical protein